MWIKILSKPLKTWGRAIQGNIQGNHPSAKAGLIIAAVFCFILSFGDFVAPYYLGGSKPPTLSILIIDTTKSGQQWPRAAVVAVMMMTTLMIVAFTAIKLAYSKKT